MKSFSESYKAAGVDITAGYAAVELMKSHVARTMTPGALSGLGGFGGLFQLDLVAWLFGGQAAVLSRVIYTLVALGGVWCVSLLFRDTAESLEQRE